MQQDMQYMQQYMQYMQQQHIQHMLGLTPSIRVQYTQYSRDCLETRSSMWANIDSEAMVRSESGLGQGLGYTGLSFHARDHFCKRAQHTEYVSYAYRTRAS